MQRWIIAAGVFLVLLVGGGAFGYRTYKQNRPTRVWLQVQINPEASAESRSATVKMLTQRLGEHARLARVSKDVGLTRKMKVATDDAAANDLEKRLFVELGEFDTPKGKVPSINIGLNCKVKESATMGAVITRMGKDLARILGLPEPGTKGF